ncbi:MAG: siroheme synthase CysG [Pseudomonadota bacterium]
MFYLPLFHNLKGRPCLVVGGGTTALRKLRWLVRAEADVLLVAPEIGEQIEALAQQDKVRIRRESFAADLVHPDLVLVISATNDSAVNRQVYDAAQQARVLVNCVDQPELCTVIFPAIVDRHPILVAISSMGAAPTLARVVRGWIEARLPAGLGGAAELAQRLRDTVKARFPSTDERKTFWEKLFTGPIAEVAVLGDVDGAEAAAREAIANAGESTGSVALVGAGPGDPELLTLKALRLLQMADVVLYDKLSNEKILDYARRDAEFIYVGKQGPKPGSPPTRPDNRSNQQGSINDLIVQHAQQGKQVVRLKGGDPFIYGRGGGELETAGAAGLDVLVVPGITAAMGAASYAGIPLTYRNLSLSVRFITGHRIENTINLDWPELNRDSQTLVIYMGLVGLREIMASLLAHGGAPDRPVAIVENATYPHQRVIRGTVADIADRVDAANVQGPSVAIVGEVVALAQPVLGAQIET